MMKPTNKLRFVRREVGIRSEEYTSIAVTNLVLQQWWASEDEYDHVTENMKGEWRDVPIEAEEQ